MQEIDLRDSYLADKTIQTIYFGGGTPSLLSANEIANILDRLVARYQIATNAEITLEANPDDLKVEKVKALAEIGINRLSIGIQSFHDADLQLMNRAHNAGEALQCVKIAQDVGISNISIDLIYGSPSTSHEMWEANLQQTFELGVPHVSAYCLTVEPKTALAYMVQKGQVPDVEEEHAAQQFERLIAATKTQGFLHYEISNFGKPGFLSQHNSSYWKGVPYLGLGPAAHSFNGITRQWNVANNAQYIRRILAGEIPAEVEDLSVNERFNEYLMTSLRTMWGCSLKRVEELFGSAYQEALQEAASPYLKVGKLVLEEGHLKVTDAGKFVVDGVISDLMRV